MKVKRKSNSLTMRTTMFMLAFAGLNLCSNAQNVVWKKNFGGSGDDIIRGATALSDGVVVVGYSEAASFGTGDWTNVAGKGERDAIIVKYDNNGNIQWKKNFGGDSWDDFLAVTAVSDGIIAVGSSFANSFGTGDWINVIGKGGGDDAIIVKYDFNGNVLWKKNFGGSKNDEFNGVTMVTDGIIVVGTAQGGSFGNGDWVGITGKGVSESDIDAIIVKYDFNGNVLWKKNHGGRDADYYHSVTIVLDGIVTVGSSGPISGDGDWWGFVGNRDYDATIVKYDFDGNVLWKRKFGGSGSDEFQDVTAVSDGIIAVGSSDSSSFGNGELVGISAIGNGINGIMVKYDYSGNVMWRKNINGLYNSVVAVSDNVITTGSNRIVKYNTNGDIIWEKIFSSDNFSSVMTISDDIIVVGNLSQSQFGNGDWIGVAGKGYRDGIVVKFTEKGVGITAVSGLSNIKIYPNPSIDKFVVEFDGIASVKLYNMLGQEVLTQTVNDKTEININHLPQGVYNVRIFSEGKVVENSKITKY